MMGYLKSFLTKASMHSQSGKTVFIFSFFLFAFHARFFFSLSFPFCFFAEYRKISEVKHEFKHVGNQTGHVYRGVINFIFYQY